MRTAVAPKDRARVVRQLLVRRSTLKGRWVFLPPPHGGGEVTDAAPPNP